MKKEQHSTTNMGWLRAAVLGANDGLLSTASLVLGVAAAHGSRGNLLVAGTAGMAAGAMSMAAGEYVSVSSQADSEAADIAKEKHELATDAEGELQELTQIYVARGLDQKLARTVAEQLTAKDALAAHTRDELGITEELSAQPVQAAFASALSFACGGLVPVLLSVFWAGQALVLLIPMVSLICLAVLGAMAAHAGGAPILKGALRVTFWGFLAMATTYGIGRLCGNITPG